MGGRIKIDCIQDFIDLHTAFLIFLSLKFGDRDTNIVSSVYYINCTINLVDHRNTYFD